MVKKWGVWLGEKKKFYDRKILIYETVAYRNTKLDFKWIKDIITILKTKDATVRGQRKGFDRCFYEKEEANS
jgi:hypothetical protein